MAVPSIGKAIRFDTCRAMLVAALVATGMAAGCGGGGSAPVTSIVEVSVPTELDLAAAQYGIDASGVGGDSGGDGGVGGAAGDGSPIRRAQVTLMDAKGNQVSGSTDANGKYLLKYATSQFTPPFVLRVIDSGGNVLTSALDVGAAKTKVVYANINPLTDKITSDILTSVAGTDKTFDGSKLDISRLAKAKADLVASVQSALGVAGVANVGSFDPVKTVYDYNGTGVDAVIESVSLSRDASTGATQLRAKLSGLQNNADGLVVGGFITANSPLSTSSVALPSNPGLTFNKLDSWVAEVNRCLALTATQFVADSNCADADGTRLVSLAYLHSGRDFREDFRTLASNGDGTYVKDSTLRNANVLFVAKYAGSTAFFDDMAVVELTVRQPSSGPLAGNSAAPLEYTKVVVFKRDDSLTRSKAGNWILHGNQNRFDGDVFTRYIFYRQLNSTVPNGSFIETRTDMRISTKVFDRTSRSLVDAGIRAVRVTGPGLSAAGVVLVPTSSLGLANLAILNKSGTIPPLATSTASILSGFGLATASLAGVPFNNGAYSPTIVSRPDAPMTDFGVMQAFSKYKLEYFLRGSSPQTTTPDVVQFSYNLAPAYSPSVVATVPLNDVSPSSSLVTRPAPAAQSLTVQWTNNPSAGPVIFAQVDDSSNYLVADVASAYTLGSRPTNQVVTAPSAPFEALTLTSGSREVAIWSIHGRALMQSLVSLRQ